MSEAPRSPKSSAPNLPPCPVDIDRQRSQGALAPMSSSDAACVSTNGQRPNGVATAVSATATRLSLTPTALPLFGGRAACSSAAAETAHLRQQLGIGNKAFALNRRQLQSLFVEDAHLRIAAAESGTDCVDQHVCPKNDEHRRSCRKLKQTSWSLFIYSRITVTLGNKEN
jgi:hypothetical protein